MKVPRPRQRFPAGGKNLYDLLRQDFEPSLIWVWESSHVFKRQQRLIKDRWGESPTYTAEQYANDQKHKDDYTLAFERAFDPMLYFWPVHQQHVVVMLDAIPDDKFVKRMGEALLRDGVDVAEVVWSRDRTPEERAQFSKDWLTTSEIRHFGSWETHLERRPDIARRIDEYRQRHGFNKVLRPS